MNDSMPSAEAKDWRPLRPMAPTTLAGGEAKLQPGDRLPDFVLPDPETQLHYLYQTVTGGPTILVLAANTAQQQQWDEIKGFAAAMPALRDAGIGLIIVSNDGVESLAMVAKTIPEHAVWLADIKGVVNLGLRAAAKFDFKGVVCFLLDGNQRIIAMRGPEPGQAEWALAQHEARMKETPQQLSTVAPVLILPAVLDAVACRRLTDQLAEADGATGSAPIADPALAGEIAKLMLRRVGPEVEKAFTFDDFVFEATALRWDDASTAGSADRRREIDDPAVQGRYFVLLLDLASEGYKGGEILFPEYGPHSYRPGTGGAVVFSGTLMRELKPVTAGRRCLLTTTLRRTQAVGGKDQAPA